MNNCTDDSLIGALIELQENRFFFSQTARARVNKLSCLFAGTKVMILEFKKGGLVKVLTPDGTVCIISMFAFSHSRGVDVWEQEISNRLDKW